MGLTLEPDGANDAQIDRPAHGTLTALGPGQLVEEPVPRQQITRGENTRSFRANKLGRRPEHENRALGLAGELLVLDRERQLLIAAGYPGLAEFVVHTAVVEGDGAGFDIASFFPDGRRKYIEVKTTTGSREADFFISANEVAFAISHPDNYELCRVFDYDYASNSGRFYSVSGTLFKNLHLTPTQFRVGQLTAL
ncbi:MAG TPA: DUF3883 domain-containing protein [Aggregatilineales bacterium]|nr:DUF3883 domain-containing protein [Aggregatilineales bacterium]